MNLVDEHSGGDACPRCGGRVEMVMRSSLGPLDGPEDWWEVGVCESCSSQLTRPIGPAERPVIAMAPLDSWRESDDEV